MCNKRKCNTIRHLCNQNETYKYKVRNNILRKFILNKMYSIISYFIIFYLNEILYFYTLIKKITMQLCYFCP